MNVAVNRSYLSFIDWLKCLGMLLILYGHLVGWAPLTALAPIYSKQLGVAFFLFATSYSLSRETRDRGRVVFNRLFEVYLFGFTVALIVSILSVASGGRAQLSNYYPLLTGVNVALNSFPANPTSWYLGTYVHVILLWALLRSRLRVTAPLLAISFVGEIIVRAVLIETAGGFVAYMVVPNWLTVLLLGYWYGQREPYEPRPRASDRVWSASNGWSICALVLLLTGWSLLSARVPFEHTFPFMQLRMPQLPFGALLVSAMVSTVYLSVTLLAFRSVERLPAPAPVRFVSRNTLLIFLVHMPLFRAIEPVVRQWTSGSGMRSAIYMIVCLPGLALLSEGVQRLVRPRDLRDRLYVRVQASVASRRFLAASQELR